MTSQYHLLSSRSVTFHTTLQCVLSDPLPVYHLTYSRQLRHGNWSLALPSLPFVVPVPSLVKEEGSACVPSWVHFLPCFVVVRMILGRLMGQVMEVWWSCWSLLDLGRVGLVWPSCLKNLQPFWVCIPKFRAIWAPCTPY